jgi:hypothetical protein
VYGTVMIGRLTGSTDELVQALKDWETERHVKGFVDSRVMLGDDGQTVVNAVRFESKADYDALADDPEQDRWWRERFRPLLADEPQWIDGSWLEP